MESIRVLYRIYTEDINRENIIGLVAEQFSNFTIIKGDGHWGDQQEKSLIVEIITVQGDDVAKIVKGIAAKIRDYNKQDAVLVTAQLIDSELI